MNFSEFIEFCSSNKILTSPFVGELQKYRCEQQCMVLVNLCVEFKCEEKLCCVLFNRHVLWILERLLSLFNNDAPHRKLILSIVFLC